MYVLDPSLNDIEFYKLMYLFYTFFVFEESSYKVSLSIKCIQFTVLACYNVLENNCVGILLLNPNFIEVIICDL